MKAGFSKISSEKLFNIAARADEKDVIQSCLEVLEERKDIECDQFKNHVECWVLSGLLHPDHFLATWIRDRFKWEISESQVDVKKSSGQSHVYRPTGVFNQDKSPGEMIIESLLCLPFEQKNWTEGLNKKEIHLTQDEKKQLLSLFSIKAFEPSHVMWAYVQPYLNDVQASVIVELQTFDMAKKQEELLREARAELNQAQKREAFFGPDAVEEKMKKLREVVGEISGKRAQWVKKAQESASEEVAKIEAIFHDKDMQKVGLGKQVVQEDSSKEIEDALGVVSSLSEGRLKKQEALSPKEASKEIDRIFGRLK